ncbi:DUF6011 domain-containing protein [Nonomuraea lactucae]
MRCEACKHTLKTPASRALGLGPWAWTSSPKPASG